MHKLRNTPIIFDYTRNESSTARLHLRLKRNVHDATVWIAVADTVARRSCWHPGYRINLRYRRVSHIHISIYIIYTFIYICMYKNIMCAGYTGGIGEHVHGYISGKVGGGNRVTPKYFSVPFHFRLGDVSARIMERVQSTRRCLLQLRPIWRFYAATTKFEDDKF